MSKENVRKQVLEKNRTLKQKEKPGQSFISKHLKKVYPLGIQKSNSSQSLSSLSQTSSDSVSFINGSITPRDRPKTPMSPTRKIPRTPMSLVSELRPLEKEKPPVPVANNVGLGTLDSEDGNLKRCHWITKNSDKTYVQFHDECWGVPVYDDIQLFELLALSGMLMYHLWAEIIKRKEQYREAFARFDPNFVAKLSEKEIKEISSNKDLALVESQVVKEFGSFSSYLWGYMNYTPMINRYRYPKSVPLRSMKSEAVSRDLLRRGFRFVGPIIVYSFMQAAGMTVDHLVDCFRFGECVNLVEKRYGCG
ncbi:Dna-3-methyladenine glycosylase [Thalictrum thalictroides]|uniref:Dna-3-methyladenine glycosylase n=1 Tax=Thalictrum thalictroides TaxID=46969 RepID=A0A7J6V9H4_THATH|nr:Dna-3-methyladenine glycosylase [Thalictrum thalictroides]